MSAIHEITEEWQREGLSPTWVKLQQAQAEFDALHKQMESQKDEWLSWQAKREELEKDAARYRWLRNEAHPDYGPAVAEHRQNDWGKWYYTFPRDAALDAAIDEAMRGE